MDKTNKSSAAAQNHFKIIMEALAAPFAARDVKFKPAVVSGNRALALAYVDARVIQDRLDQVLGVDGWQDDYKCLEDGCVVCRLRLKLGTEWVSKVDVGSPSDQGDAGDRRKAAFSDALKRAAVKFGIGRYLYRFPAQWVDYDPYKKQFTQAPKLPAFAIVKSDHAPKEDLANQKNAIEAVEKKNGSANMPKNGAELQRRLYDKDAMLAKQGLCVPGTLVKRVVEAGVKEGHDPDLSTWSGPAILLAAEVTKSFEMEIRKQLSEQREVA